MIDWVLEYKKAIDSGAIRAGKRIRQAIERDFRDREKSKNPDYPYIFDLQKADKIIKFMELLTTREGKPLKLELFQKWLSCELFGWVRKDGQGLKYSEALISFSRKNGKSFFCSLVANYYLLLEKNPPRGKEVLITANNFQQAKITFDMCASELEALKIKSPLVRERLKINNAEIKDFANNSKVFVKANNVQGLQGFASTLGILDEYSEFTSRLPLETLKSGMMNEHSLLLIISTAGTNLSSPMYNDVQIAYKVLDGKVNLENKFYAIWENDNEDEVVKSLKDPMLLEKSNPLLANEQVKKQMLPRLLEEIKSGLTQNSLNLTLVRNCNIWKQASKDSFIELSDWRKAQIKAPNIEGQKVFIGVDLSRTSDLSSVGFVIPMELNGKNVFYMDSYSFIPSTKEALEEKSKKDHFNYSEAITRKEASRTIEESGVINYRQVADFIKEYVRKNKLSVQGLGYDNWFSSAILEFLKDTGWNLIEVRQGYKTLSAPIVYLREGIKKGTVLHRENHLFNYSALNAIVVPDSNNNLLLDKKQRALKIDPIASCLDAWVLSWDYYSKTHHDSNYYSSDKFSF